MPNTICYACQSSQSNFYASENGSTLVKCSSCGLLYVNTRPAEEEITQAHKLGQHRGDETIDVTGKFKPHKVVNYGLILEDFFGEELSNRSRKWLDIGCGHGEFVKALNEFSGGKVEALGLEPNVKKQESARKHGLNVTNFDLASHDQKYDVISFLNVWSHLPDPPSIMESWARHLKPGGEFFIETGDTADMPADKHYRPFFLPDHLSFATEKIVVGILENIGFEILSVRKYPYKRFTYRTFIKELVKAIVPGKSSQVKYMVEKIYQKTDMYIRARRKN